MKKRLCSNCVEVRYLRFGGVDGLLTPGGGKNQFVDGAVKPGGGRLDGNRRHGAGRNRHGGELGTAGGIVTRRDVINIRGGDGAGERLGQRGGEIGRGGMAGVPLKFILVGLIFSERPVVVVEGPGSVPKRLRPGRGCPGAGGGESPRRRGIDVHLGAFVVGPERDAAHDRIGGGRAGHDRDIGGTGGGGRGDDLSILQHVKPGDGHLSVGDTGGHGDPSGNSADRTGGRAEGKALDLGRARHRGIGIENRVDRRA